MGTGRSAHTVQVKLFAIFLLAVRMVSADDYSEWRHSQAFILNTTAGGAEISEDMLNFPVLIRLNSDNFSSFFQTLPGGADIRFAKSDDTHLQYQIGRWVDHSGDNDTAEIWVKLDTVYGDNDEQYFKMYWGNGDAADSSDASLVFRTQYGYMATYHLDGNLQDATSNGCHGTEPDEATDDVPNGIIGHARYFDGTSHFQAGDLPDRDIGTISFWFRPQTTFNASSSTTQGLWGKTESETFNANISLRGGDWHGGGGGATGQIQTKAESEEGGFYNNSTTSVFNAGVWYHLAWIWGNGIDRIFINGQLESEASNTQLVTGSSNDEIGRAYYDGQNIDDGGPRYFNGTIDEFRIENVYHSINWIRLCYENQKKGQELVTIVDTDRDLIITQPHDTTGPVGETISFSVTAEGQEPLTYKWLQFRDDSVGNSATLSFKPVYPDDDGAQYCCVVRDDFGTDSSDWVMLTVIDTPRIDDQPLDVEVTVGENATISVTVHDSRLMTFSWHKVGSDSVLAVEGSFTISEVAFSDSGDYYCVCSTIAGRVNSDTVRLTVNHIPPVITGQPVAMNVVEGDNAEFAVEASGNAPPSYAWRRVGSDSLFSTEAEMSITETALSDSGDYYCIVSNPGGTIYSDTVRLTVTIQYLPPSITVQPSALSVVEGDTAAFTLVADGTAPLSYVWRKTGSESIHGTAATFTITGTAFSDTGDYFCIVTNPAGMVQSDTVRLSVEFRDPVAKFSFAPKRGPVPLQVEFTDVSTGKITSRKWLFGDGDSSSADDPVHVYSQPGRYTVTLMVAGPGGADTLVKPDSVNAYKDTSGLVNSIRIDTAWFDSMNGLVRISWCIDSAALGNDPEVGIIHAYDGYPTEHPGDMVISVQSTCTDTAVRLSGSIRVDISCYVALWLRTGDGGWLAPTDSSKYQFIIGHSLREVITVFNPDTPVDTISVFNGQVFVWRDETYTGTETVTDTLEIASYDSLPEGMVIVGTPFAFRQGISADSIFIAVRVDSLPDEKSLKDVRIYRDSAGIFMIERETGADPGLGIVFLKTDDLCRSFVAMLDTVAPSADVFSDMTQPVSSGGELEDSVRIIDNSGDVRWRYFYGKGDEVPVLRQKGFVRSGDETVVLTIADTSQAVSSETGLRALLVIDDGCHIDTMNLSRSVYRQRSDEIVAGKNIWSPVCPTAHLLRKDADRFIEQLMDGRDDKSYNPRHVRLYRWVSCVDNEGESDKWIEYDERREENSALFSLEPGRMFWLKTRKNVSMYLDSGYTLSLRDTFTLDLPPKEWTDFGMPYRFRVPVREILASTGYESDSLQFYCWIRDSSANMYMLDPYYVPGMPDKEDRAVTVDYLPRGGYSIYNRHEKTVVLRIPPVPSCMTGGVKKTANRRPGSWSMKFVARADGNAALPPVYLGYAPGSAGNAYPSAPSFSPLRLSVVNRQTTEQYGHFISEDAKFGIAGELLISNSSDSAYSLRYRLERVGAFPTDYSSLCYDAEGNDPDTCGSLTVAPRTTVSHWAVAGDAAFQQRFISKYDGTRFALHSIYPNPSRSAATIRYTVPFGTHQHVIIAIYGMSGKKVWEKKIGGLLSEGRHEVSWDGRDRYNRGVAAGFYVVRLTVENRYGKAIRYFQESLLFLN